MVTDVVNEFHGTPTSIWVQSSTLGERSFDHAAECARVRATAGDHTAPVAAHHVLCRGPLLCPGRGLQSYNRFRLREAFKLMGCKLQVAAELNLCACAMPLSVLKSLPPRPQHADELTSCVFIALAATATEPSTPGAARPVVEAAAESCAAGSVAARSGAAGSVAACSGAAVSGVLVSYENFLRAVYGALLRLHYSAGETLLHFCIACDVKEQRATFMPLGPPAPNHYSYPRQCPPKYVPGRSQQTLPGFLVGASQILVLTDPRL